MKGFLFNIESGPKKCDTCKSEIKNVVFYFEGLTLCKDDYEVEIEMYQSKSEHKWFFFNSQKEREKIRCSVCDEPVTGKYIESEGKIFCPADYKVK